jgi:hypothetical protein
VTGVETAVCSGQLQREEGTKSQKKNAFLLSLCLSLSLSLSLFTHLVFQPEAVRPHPQLLPLPQAAAE